jgi:hypothetical protein
MRVVSRIEKPTSRALARWIGSVLAMSFGMVCFFAGTDAFTKANDVQTPLGIILYVSANGALVSMLPLAVVAIFRPRFAAHALACSFLILYVSGFATLNWREMDPQPALSHVVSDVWWYFGLPIGTLGLLLYGSVPGPVSSADAAHHSGNEASVSDTLITVLLSLAIAFMAAVAAFALVFIVPYILRLRLGDLGLLLMFVAPIAAGLPTFIMTFMIIRNITK